MVRPLPCCCCLKQQSPGSKSCNPVPDHSSSAPVLCYACPKETVITMTSSPRTQFSTLPSWRSWWGPWYLLSTDRGTTWWMFAAETHTIKRPGLETWPQNTESHLNVCPALAMLISLDEYTIKKTQPLLNDIIWCSRHLLRPDFYARWFNFMFNSSNSNVFFWD